MMSLLAVTHLRFLTHQIIPTISTLTPHSEEHGLSILLTQTHDHSFGQSPALLLLGNNRTDNISSDRELNASLTIIGICQ